MATTMVPLSVNAVKTNTSAPAMGYINRYDATSGALSVTLPVLSGLNVSARTMVQKHTLDGSTNPVSFTRALSDLFDDGSTSVMLTAPGESRTLQVVLISGVKRWKIVESMGAPVAAAAVNTPIRFSSAIALAGATPTDRAYISRTVTGARMRVGSAPAGSDLVAQVQHWGGTSWTTIGTLTIAAGSVVENVQTFTQGQAVGDMIRLNVTSVGSTTPAQAVVVDVLWTP